MLAMVAPALAADGPTQLASADVSPRTGTPATTITFEVLYHNHEGSPPDHVNVVVDGVVHAMSGDGDWKRGVVMHWAAKLPVGTHDVSFDAADTPEVRVASRRGHGHDQRARSHPGSHPQAHAEAGPHAQANPHARPDPKPAA